MVCNITVGDIADHIFFFDIGMVPMYKKKGKKDG